MTQKENGKFTTKFLNEFHTFLIKENKSDKVYHIDTFINEGGYPCIDVNDLAPNLKKRAYTFHAINSEYCPILPLHRLNYVLYYDKDILCDRLTHKGFCIHHADKNRLNCDIKNLICMTYDEHKNLHKRCCEDF